MRCILGSNPRYSNHRVTLLAGGVGGARMARALRAVLDPGLLTVIVNVGDDTERYGVHVSPDPDTVLYTLADVVGPHGWGRENDTTSVMDSLDQQGIDTSFTLGDLDLGLCMARTLLLQDGEPLSAVTKRFAANFGLDDITLLPASDDLLRTFVEIADASWLPFQEYFVDRQHSDAVQAIAYHGAVDAKPAPGVIDAIGEADTVLIAPSNPPLSIWPILAIDEIDAAVVRHANTAAVSPLFGGSALKGPAREVMHGLGLPPGTRGVLEAYARHVDTLFIDSGDARDQTLGSEFDIRVEPCDTRLTPDERGRSFASHVLETMTHG
ncbi:MAG: 2-phospho-L-lactate transferase CofD family protein [Acidimicrobiia bacterium]